MNVLFGRIALPTALVAFSLICLAVPMLRHRRLHGEGSGFVLAQVKDPVERVVGWAMTVQSNAVGAWVFLFAAFGPEPLSVWTGGPPELAYVGLGLMAAATLTIAAAQAQMGRSWRMCNDRAHTPLVTSGLFSVVRNPIYACTIVLVVGVMLVTPSPWTACLVWTGCLNVSLQARLEEAHLFRLHGEAYASYASRVGRFLPGIGRIDPAELAEARA